MANIGKRINLQKKFKSLPSTQSSGIPLKGFTSVSRIQNIKYKKEKNINPYTFGPNTDYPVFDEHYTVGMVNPFYNYLLDNCITRTIDYLYSTATVSSFEVTATGIDYLLREGDTFYIYNPYTFFKKQLTCKTDLLSAATTLRIDSTSFVKGFDVFPSGSFIVADNKLVTERASNAIEYKKYTFSNAEYTALADGYTLLAADTDVLHIPINCAIEYIHGADELVDYDLYLGHGNGSTTTSDFWGKIPSFVYRSRNDELYDIGAFTNSLSQKNRSTNSSGEGLFLYSDGIPTSASSYIIVHLFYKSLSTA